MFGAMSMAAQMGMESGRKDVWKVKEVRYLGSTEYNLFMHPGGSDTVGICIGGFPNLEELEKLGDMIRSDLASGRELSESFREGAEQILAAIAEARS